MAGVSDSGPDWSADIQSIMEGGQNWTARMEAFLKAKADAQAMVDQAKIAGDILAVRDEARADREAAAKELADAKASANALVMDAQAKASDAMAAASADADKLRADAQAKLDDATKAAQTMMDDAQKRLVDANTAMALATQRSDALDIMKNGLDARSDALTVAQTEASAMKAKYAALVEKMNGFLADLAKEAGE